jgi:BON domain
MHDGNYRSRSEFIMANHNSSVPGQRSVDDDRTQWRPDDDDATTERDGERRDHRPTEREGQGQSGYGAGRRGEDFSQNYQNRNETHRPGSFDDQPSSSGMGLDDRFDRTDHRERTDNGADHPGRDRSADRENGHRNTVYRGMGGHRGKGPQNWQRSDERIREAVNEVLADHDHIDATHIEVTVLDGEVTLSGAVEDRTMKRLAEDCVEQVSGVKEVQNLIRIQRHDGRSAGAEGTNRVSGDVSTPVGDRKPRA